MKVNPLSYGVAAIRDGLYWSQAHSDAAVAFCVTLAFAVVMFVGSLLAAQRTTAGDLQ